MPNPCAVQVRQGHKYHSKRFPVCLAPERQRFCLYRLFEHCSLGLGASLGFWVSTHAIRHPNSSGSANEHRHRPHKHQRRHSFGARQHCSRHNCEAQDQGGDWCLLRSSAPFATFNPSHRPTDNGLDRGNAPTVTKCIPDDPGPRLREASMPSTESAFITETHAAAYSHMRTWEEPALPWAQSDAASRASQYFLNWTAFGHRMPSRKYRPKTKPAAPIPQH
jgi:hypothetical protein